MRVLVCGGRDLDPLKVSHYLYDLFEKLLTDEGISVNVIIHGDAKGADKGARLLAEILDIFQLPFPADWNGYGKRAGPIRNRKMLTEANPDIVVAFPGGSGTADMVSIAEEAGVRLIKIEGEFH